ncbi:hypothetical protein ACN8ZM_33450 [Burkholderia aenigmatica]|uniref:hypothetical protein n=1 Tax=Burkholderia aenigmatica TaxID=2015348 RepID=UPI003B4320EC
MRDKRWLRRQDAEVTFQERPVSARPHDLSVSPYTSIDSLREKGDLVAFNAGPDGAVYMVFALEPLDYRTEAAGGASFAKTEPATSQRYRVMAWQGGEVRVDCVIADEPFNIHDIQPVGDDLLLVCCRSVRRGDGDFDLNGRFYRRDGTPCGAILLGDGIEAVQATAAGDIWTSYFDEGVYGNLGWDSPVGAPGLIAWSRAGEQRYAFVPSPGFGPIDCCYALNVPSDRDAWVYYYNTFALVRVRDRHTVWSSRMPVNGSYAFAVMEDATRPDGYVALFCGSYQDSDMLYLVRIDGGGDARLVRTYRLLRNGAEPVGIARMTGRGQVLHAVGTDGNLYRIDIADLALG